MSKELGKRISDEQLTELVEAAIFVAGKPLSRQLIRDTVLADFNVSTARLSRCLDALTEQYMTRGMKLGKLGSG